MVDRLRAESSHTRFGWERDALFTGGTAKGAFAGSPSSLAGASFDVALFAKGEKWSGRRESNPRMQLGKLPFYH